MRSGTIAFFLGALGAQLFPALPEVRLCGLLPLLLFLAWRIPRARLPALALAGLLWAIWRAHFILAERLPADLEGETITVAGRVTGLPESIPGRVRFLLATESLTRGNSRWPGCGRVRLDWRGEPTPVVRTGERWRLQVRLKQPHGFRNPGTFDYEGWLFQNRIRATGYVIDDGQHERIAERGWSVDGVRETIRQRLHARVGAEPLGGVVAALAIGARDSVTEEQWRVFFRTNTGHLIAISGLHIGLLAGVGYLAGRWLWSRSARALFRVAAPRVGAVCGFLAALLYSALAGFEVPAQRTLIMIAVVMLGLWMNRRYGSIDRLLLALWMVLLLDPIAVLSVGFWLSFIAVAILLYSTAGTAGGQRLWRRLGRAHLAMGIGLAPVLALLFGQNPVVGPIANFVAVPWVSFVVVPLVLLGTFLLVPLPALGGPLLQGAVFALDGLWRLLAPLAALDFASLPAPHPGWIALGCAAVGSFLLLMPGGLSGRAAGLIWMLPLALPAPARPAAGELWITVLDVGQGLSAIVRTRHHALVFDSGPRYSERFNAGEAVVVPHLRHGGVRELDMLIVSHDDMDHAGGTQAVLEEVRVQEVLSSAPLRLDHPRLRQRACRAGQSWRWDGVRFEFLHPSQEQSASDNNSSCVLRVRAPGGTALLPADIEAKVERDLVRRHGKTLRADILIAPHHGSTSSSSVAFVRAVAPRYVVYPVGYRNRYGFPGDEVRRRYRDIGALALRSDEDGAVTFHIGGSVGAPIAHRRTHRRYWHSP